jgi:hypothetical protein
MPTDEEVRWTNRESRKALNDLDDRIVPHLEFIGDQLERIADALDILAGRTWRSTDRID